MISLTGKKLEDYVQAIPNIADYKKRFCYDDFKNLVVNTIDMKVVALYGLLRTGKSILMAQLVIDIGQYDDICLIQCHDGDDMSDLQVTIDKHSHCQYIFIEEATKLEWFAAEASDLAYIYSSQHRIILTGDDSLVLYITSNGELYGKMHMLHTTYISYEEYHYLLVQDRDDYLMHGGTLTPERDFYSQEQSQEYVNTAIAENIQHSLDSLGRNGEYGILATFRHNDELTTFFNKIIELYNRQFLANIINEKFESAGIAKINISFREVIMNTLHSTEIMSEKTIDKTIYEAKKYLQALDVVSSIPDSDEVIFTQPGLRYSYCVAQIEAIAHSCHIEPHEKRKIIEELFTNFDGDYISAEVDWGEPVGKEVW